MDGQDIQDYRTYIFCPVHYVDPCYSFVQVPTLSEAQYLYPQAA